MGRVVVITMGVTAGVVAMLAMTACGSEGSEGASEPTTTSTTASVSDSGTALDGSTFTSTGSSGRDLVPGSTVTLTFADANLSVIAGCNSISSSYEYADDTLSFTGQPRTTLMGCEQPLADQDTFLTTWLTDGVTVTRSGDSLTLSGSGVTIDFAKGGGETASLVGPTWTLETVTQADAASSVPTSAQAPTLVFGEDGSVEVFSGCNTGGTSVTTTSDTLTFSPMRLTKMACEEPAMTLESTVTTVLDGDVTYVLDGNQLTLAKGTTSLTYAGS